MKTTLNKIKSHSPCGLQEPKNMGNNENHSATQLCSWCGEQILVGQYTSKSYDGEVMHFGCACEADDADMGDCSF